MTHTGDKIVGIDFDLASEGCRRLVRDHGLRRARQPESRGRLAAKFALVEGLSLDAASVDLLERSKAAGLKGDALRAAIVGSFRKK